jgi:hypothetical protein
MAKVKQVMGVARLYIKPALGKIIIRKAGVTRQSAAVIERNTKFKEWAKGTGGAVVACRGQPWDQFIHCLKDKATTLGPGTAKTREYRKKFWKWK